MRSLDPLVKLNAGLNKELLDTGLRAALNVQDVENAVRLARFSESAVSLSAVLIPKFMD